jgi:hypothetical protein
MTTYVLASVGVGVLLVVLDALLNVNPLAQRIHSAYEPIARKTMNPVPAVVIDVAYGFLVAGLYLLLREALPGTTWLVKAASFAAILWLLRVVMAAASHWVMFDVPARVHLYDLAAGLVEMLAIAALCAGVLGAGA